MVHKHIDAYKHEREARRRAYMSAPSLKDRYPTVEQLVLELTFVDASGSSQHSPQTHIFGPGARSYFEVACPFSSCTGGGFDLSAVVADLLSHRDRGATGKLVCGGWQDRGRAGEHRCLLELRYRVSASFEALVEVPGRPRRERPGKWVAR